MIAKLDLTGVGEEAVEDDGAGGGLDVVFPEEDFSGGVVDGEVLEVGGEGCWAGGRGCDEG